MRALIAGLGAVGQRHARNLRAMRPDIELLAYRQRGRAGVISNTLDYNATADPAEALGMEVFTNLESALGTAPDVAVICTPTSQHASIALQAAAAGCHLYIEKPVSHSLDGLAQLDRIADTSHLVVAIGCQWRFHPCVERLRAILSEGVLGEIRRADINFSEFLPDWHPYEDYRESYAARSEMGGGVVLSQIHDYDLACWLFGPVGTVVATSTSGAPLDVDAEHTVQAQFDAGSARVFVRQTYAESARVRTIRVQGANADAVADLVAGTLSLTPAVAEGAALGEYDRNEMFRACLQDFIRCVESGGGNTAPRTTLRDGSAVLRVALAVRESARRGIPIAAS